MTKRRVVLATAMFVVAATLFPEGRDPGPISVCIFCGERALADTLLNLLLFVPFGIALRRSGASLRFIIAVSAALSTSVELAQLIVPGRSPSVADLLFNTAGGAIGALVFDRWSARPALQAPRFALAMIAMAAALAALSICTWLLAPAFPHNKYYGQWTPEFENMEHYRGRIIGARIGFTQLPSEVLRDPTVRHRLLAGATVVVQFIVGPAPERPAPIFNIYDDQAREVVSIAAHGHDLLIRYRTRAATLLLDEPSFRLRNGLEQLRPGDTAGVQVRRVRGGVCVRLNRNVHCPVGFTPGSTSGVLMHIASATALNRLLNLLWLAALFFPAGLYVRRARDAIIVGTLSCVGLALVPAALGLLSPPVGEFAAVLAGIAAGAATRQRYLQRSE